MPWHGPQGLLQPLPLISRPFECVGMDLIGPLPVTHAGCKYILVVMDYLAKWPEVVVLPDKKAGTVAKAFIEHVIC